MDVGWCTSNISWAVRPLISNPRETKTSPAQKKTLRGTGPGWANSSGLTHGDIHPAERMRYKAARYRYERGQRGARVGTLDYLEKGPGGDQEETRREQGGGQGRFRRRGDQVGKWSAKPGQGGIDGWIRRLQCRFRVGRFEDFQDARSDDDDGCWSLLVGRRMRGTARFLLSTNQPGTRQ